MTHSRILIKNIYYMLAYAFSVLKYSSIEKVSTETFENIHNLFAAILAHGIGQLLKQGLHREYVLKEAQLPVVRGKINLQETWKERLHSTMRVACEFDELSENNLHNQILKTTVRLLLKHADVEQRYKDDLKQKMLFFMSVDILEPKTIKWSHLQFHRNNQIYRMLINLCQFIIEGMLLSPEHGEQKLSMFLDDQHLCRLYEKFILEYYRKHHPQLKANASQIPWAVDDKYQTFLPVMQSDITLSYKKKTFIIDAKCYSNTLQKQFEKRTIHSANLYQIFTYVKNKMLQPGFTNHEIRGLLLYAKTVDTIQLDETFQMSGNQIAVKTLDLNCDFKNIKQQLDDIAAWMYC